MCAMPIFTLPYITPKYIKLYFPFASLCLLLVFVVRLLRLLCFIVPCCYLCPYTYHKKRKKRERKKGKIFVSIVV